MTTVDDLTKRIDTGRCYLPFVALYLKAIEAARARGYDYHAISGFRDALEQKALFSKGRVLRPDGTWAVVERKHVVTNAQPWESDHNYGCAIDACLDADTTRVGLQPLWNIDDYEVLAQEGARVGLTALYYSETFREGPHLGLNFARHGIKRTYLRGLHQQDAMPAVWKYLDTFDWSHT